MFSALGKLDGEGQRPPKGGTPNPMRLPFVGGLDDADVSGVEAAEALYRAGGGELRAGGFGVAKHGDCAEDDARSQHGAGGEG